MASKMITCTTLDDIADVLAAIRDQNLTYHLLAILDTERSKAFIVHVHCMGPTMRLTYDRYSSDENSAVVLEHPMDQAGLALLATGAQLLLSTQTANFDLFSNTR